MKMLVWLIRPRTLLTLAGTATLMVVLAYGYAQSRPTASSEIWVYYTSVCQRPGDASACTEVKRPVRRAFDSLKACSDYSNADLDRAANPRLMGSCLRQHEA